MRVLSVWLNDYRVGSLLNVADDRNLFTFEDTYLADPNAPVLSQGYFALSGLIQTTESHTTADPFFANLLPEGKLREYLAERDHVSPERDFSLLAILGEDLPGAVRLREESISGDEPSIIETAQARAQRGGEPLLRFSLAGVQLKFSAIQATDGGLTIPTSGGSHIIKLPSSRWSRVPENEWAMMTYARAVGISVPPFSLVPLESIANLPSGLDRMEGRSAFLIERFDRTRDGRRIHIEDFAQVFRVRPARKYHDASYGSIARALNALQPADLPDFIGRLVFNIGIGNADAHLKNWSLIYDDPTHPRLSPAYDLVSTIQYLRDDKLALSISRTKQWTAMTFDLLERFARHAGVPSGTVKRAADDMVAAMHDTWPRVKDDLNLTANEIDTIEKHQATIPLFNPRTSILKAVEDKAPQPQPEIA